MIEIYHCGYDSHHKAAPQITYDAGLPSYLFLIVKTPAYFIIDGHSMDTRDNMMILLRKHTKLRYGSRGSSYNDDWIRFDFHQEKALPEELAIPLNQPLYLPCVHRFSDYIRLLASEMHAKPPTGIRLGISWFEASYTAWTHNAGFLLCLWKAASIMLPSIICAPRSTVHPTNGGTSRKPLPPWD